MSQKKTTTKGSTKGKAEGSKKGKSVAARARAIVADEAGYDRETREAVAHSLEHDGREDLAETVERAESGDLILDVRIHAAQYVDFAKTVATVATHRDTPAHLKSALQRIAAGVIDDKSGYEWAADAEGLSFMLPRLLSRMDNDFAQGIIDTVEELALGELPETVRSAVVKGAER